MKMKFYFGYILVHIFLGQLHSVTSVNYVKHTLNIIVKKLEQAIEDTVRNTECGNDLKMLIHDLLKRRKWAVQMIDASAKIEPGLLVGNVNQMGNYDECLAVKEITENYTITGQYCTLVISPGDNEGPSNELKGFFLDPLWVTNFIGSKAMNYLKKNMNFVKVTYGMCLPSSCTVENLRTMWKYVEYSLSPPAKVEFEDILCDYKEKPPFYIGVEPYIFAAFIVYFCVILGATIYDVFFFDGDKDSLHSYICTLSLITNAKKLFSTQVGEDNIACINGLKVLSMLWVLLGHRFFFNAITPNVNSLYLFEWRENVESMVIIGATVSVDTFLTISGLLLSYIYLRYTELKNVRVNIFSFYILRVCRLTPPLLAAILINIAVLKYVNDGPLWPIISAKLALDCLYTGWANLLFVNNFFKLTSQCLPQSWYLSVDSQLYFLFPLIFFSIMKNPKKTLWWMFTIGMISSVSAIFITIHGKYISSPFDFRYANDLYQSTLLRMPVWLIGVATGYFVFKYKDKKLRIPGNIKFILWMTSFMTLICVVFGQVILVRNEENSVNSAFFNAFGRPLWSMTICWIIFACVTKNGGFVDRFLSLPIFCVVSKITYSLYLIHMTVILVIIGRRRHVDHFSNVRAIHEFCGDAVFSLAVGICFTLLFESPVITFAKKFFRRFEEILAEEAKSPSLNVIEYRMWFIPVNIFTHNKVD